MRILTVVGTRPNLVKAAPFLAALRDRKADSILMHTGQHYDDALSDVFFRELDMPEPDICLGVKEETHAAQTAAVMEGVEKYLLENSVDKIVVIGDVNSTLGAALAAVKVNVPVAHIEAGLRCGNMTVPEEINRILTDRISRYLFAVDETAEANLLKEGVLGENIYNAGNIIADTVFTYTAAVEKSGIADSLNLASGTGYVLVTLHRPFNVDNPDRLNEILSALTDAAEGQVVFPVHPRTERTIREFGFKKKGYSSRIRMVEPLGYIDFSALLKRAAIVVTDSGGVQVEAALNNVPCVTVRPETEHRCTIEQGVNRLTGDSGAESLSEAVKDAYKQTAKFTPPANWDGRTSERIADVLIR